MPQTIAAITALLCLVFQATGQTCSGWVERFPLSRPAPVTFQTLSFDAARGQSILFDGDPHPDVPATWSWNGDDWTLLEDAVGPVSIKGHDAVFDTWRGVIVLYGGETKKGLESADTWEWNGVHWAERLVNPPGGVGRRLHAMAFDTHRGVTVLFGGVDDESNNLADTWEWDGKTWTEHTVFGPSPRYNHSMAFDQARGVTVLFGGGGGGHEDTWEWDGVGWTEREVSGPGTRYRAAMVYDPARQACLIFGGLDGEPLGLRDDLWAWDGHMWTQIGTPVAPPRRFDHAMAYDSSRHTIVLFGGEGDFGPLDDTWEFPCPSPCYPDLDGDGDLTLFDFLAYVNLFNAGGDTADCDESGSLDLFDFLCFVNAFNEGC
jgi:hypothetical protein